jgi:hypothetical protein
MRTRILSLFALSCFFMNATSVKTMTLREAIKQKLVVVDTKGKGGYTGNVLLVSVKNVSGRHLDLELEAGLRFHPDDSGQQDILVTGDEIFALDANRSRSIDVNGMCCISENHSPSKGMNFTLLGLADTGLVRVARYIDQHKMYGSDEAQDAVWVISDKIRPEAIDFTKPENKGLVDLVTGIRDIPKPEYVIDYEKDPDIPFTGNAATVKGTFTCKLTKQEELVMALYDAGGKPLEEREVSGPPMPGNFTFGYEFSVINFEKGTYYARVMVGKKVMAEVKIEI